MGNKPGTRALKQKKGMDLGEWGSVAATPLGSDFEVLLTPGKALVIPAFDGMRPHTFQFDYLAEPSEFARATLDIIATAVSTHSIGHIHRVNWTVGHAFRKGKFSFEKPISMADILNWADAKSLNCWISMKFYLLRLAAIESKCFVTDEVRQFLKDPGDFVRRDKATYLPLVANDPDFGVLTEQEMEDIHSQLNSAHATGRIDLFEYAFTWLLIATGIRPVQMARMKFGDVLAGRRDDGTDSVTLLIPSAKGIRTSTVEYSPRLAPKPLADVLTRYVSSNGSCDPDLPLFVSQNDQVGIVLRRIFRKIDTYSNRTNGPIHITPYRFRYTVATRAIALGASDAVVAALLGHKSTSSIRYYRAAVPEFQRPIREAMGEDMSLLARQFQGRVISGLDEAAFRNDRSKLVREFEMLNGSSLGACGSGIECGVSTPRACLDCVFFQPLKDAPWEWLESKLMQEIERQPNPQLRKTLERHLAKVRCIIAACNRINTRIPEGAA